MDVVSSHKHDKKHKKSDKKKKKRKRSHSSSSDNNNSDRSTSRSKKKKSKKSKKKSKHEKELSLPESGASSSKPNIEPEVAEEDYGIPLTLMNTKAKAPQSKEEYEKKQSIIRKVYDEETGRHRLIRGDGEVIEEIVSKKAHDEINKGATQADGSTFQSRLGLKD